MRRSSVPGRSSTSLLIGSPKKIRRLTISLLSCQGETLFFPGGILSCAEKVQRDIGLVAQDPTVVRNRWNIKEIARAHFLNSATLKGGGRRSRKNYPDVFDSAMRCAGRRADVFAPFPTGLIGSSSNCHFPNADNLEFAFRERAYFVGSFEAF